MRYLKSYCGFNQKTLNYNMATLWDGRFAMGPVMSYADLVRVGGCSAGGAPFRSRSCIRPRHALVGSSSKCDLNGSLRTDLANQKQLPVGIHAESDFDRVDVESGALRRLVG